MMNTPTVSLVIVTYNGQEFMSGLFDSVRKQTLKPSEVIVVENSPNNATVPEIQKCYPEATIITPGENLDFSRGYNRGIQEANSDYICIVNQDITLDSQAIEALYKALVADEKIGAVAPKLRRLTPGQETSTVLDSMGIAGSKQRRYINVGEGEEDAGQHDKDVPFGIAGTAILFHRDALEDIAAHGGGEAQEYFDDDFVAYKDDVDLSYRLRHRGWKPRVVAEAIMYHARTAQELKATEGLAADRKAKSLRIRKNSLRNQWWVLLKNEPLMNLILASPWILWYEFRKIVYIILREPSTLAGIPSAIVGLPKILRKRRAVLSSSTVSAKKLRNWFN